LDAAGCGWSSSGGSGTRPHKGYYGHASGTIGVRPHSGPTLCQYWAASLSMADQQPVSGHGETITCATYCWSDDHSVKSAAVAVELFTEVVAGWHCHSGVTHSDEPVLVSSGRAGLTLLLPMTEFLSLGPPLTFSRLFYIRGRPCTAIGWRT
jgi:hypothetical protein